MDGLFGLNPPPLLIPPNNLDLDVDDHIDPDLSSPRVSAADTRTGSFGMSPLLGTEAETSESDEIIGYRYRRQIGRRDTEFENLSKLIATMRAISKLDEALLAGPLDDTKKEEETDADRMMRLEKRMSRDSKILQRDLLAEFSGMSPGNRDDLWSKVTSPRAPSQPSQMSSAASALGLGLPRISSKATHLSAFSGSLSPVSSIEAMSPTVSSDTVKRPDFGHGTKSVPMKKSPSKTSSIKKPETSREMRRRIEAADPLEYDMIIHAPDEVKWALVQVEREMRLAEAAKYASKTSLSALARRYMYRSPYRQRDSGVKRGSSTIDLTRAGVGGGSDIVGIAGRSSGTTTTRLPRESTKLPLASSADLFTTMSETTLTPLNSDGMTTEDIDRVRSDPSAAAGVVSSSSISASVAAAAHPMYPSHPPSASRMRSRSTGETFGVSDRPRMKDRRTTGAIGSATVGIYEDESLLGSPSDRIDMRPKNKQQTTVVMTVLSEDDDEVSDVEHDGSDDDSVDHDHHRPRFEETDSHNLLTPGEAVLLHRVSDELSSVSDEDLSRNETELTESKSQPEPISRSSQPSHSKFQFGASLRSMTSPGGTTGGSGGTSSRMLMDHGSGPMSGSESPMSPTSLMIRNQERGNRRGTLSKTPREKKTSFKGEPKVRRPHTPSAYEESLDSTDKYEFDVGPDGACRMISRSMISLRSLQGVPLANRASAAGAASTDTQEDITEPVGPLLDMHSPVQSIDAGRYSATIDYSNVVTPPPHAGGLGSVTATAAAAASAAGGISTEYEHSRNESENQPETDLFTPSKRSMSARNSTVHYSTRKTTAGRMTQLASVDEHTALQSKNGESERELHALKHHISQQRNGNGHNNDIEWMGSVHSESADYGGSDLPLYSHGWLGKWQRIQPFINGKTICFALLYALLCFSAGLFTGRFVL